MIEKKHCAEEISIHGNSLEKNAKRERKIFGILWPVSYTHKYQNRPG